MPSLDEALDTHAAHCATLLAAAERAAAIADWAAYGGFLAEACRAIERRFDFGERALAPVLRRLRGSDPGVAGLHTERARLRASLAELAAADPARDPDGCRAALHGVLARLTAHRANEERATRAAREAMSDADATKLANAAQDLMIDRAPGNGASALDLRGLEPPEPMLRIIAALREAPTAPLRVRIHREPFPLYALLSEQGYSWRTDARADGSFEILIEPAPPAA